MRKPTSKMTALVAAVVAVVSIGAGAGSSASADGTATNQPRIASFGGVSSSSSCLPSDCDTPHSTWGRGIRW